MKPGNIALLCLAVLTPGCSARVTDQEAYDAASLGAVAKKTAGQPRHVVGPPYFQNGRWYRPRHQPNYSAMGKAVWYGTNRSGRATVNGEVTDAQNLFAAHRTLPLPSYVSVTNTLNGKSITVRVNDRGPIEGAGLIEVSRRAAELLAFKKLGPTPVKVKYLSPAPIEHTGRRH
jgi:peptidoglycan lytic transglycosylase